MPGSCSTRLRVSVVLPAPEGEERMRRSPRRWWADASATALLHVLDLLAELLHGRLEIEADPRHGHVPGLGAERIGLPAELLRQEVEAPPNRPAGAQKVARRGDVGAQAVDLLADVGARREQDRLLMEPRRIERPAGVEQGGDLLLQPRPDGFGLAGRRRLGGFDETFHSGEVALD